MNRKHPKHKSTKLSAARIKEIIRDNYEPGRQDRCKLSIYRNKIYPLTGISERTFWRYQSQVDAENTVVTEDPRQLSLF